MFLVTGGAGFIGSHTVALLLEEGHRVRVIDDLSSGHLQNLDGFDVEFIKGSVSDPRAVAEAMNGCSNVIHLAANPSVPGSCEDPVAYDTTNVHGTVVVFEAARREGVAQVAYASSSAVYGSSEEIPKRETMRVAAESPYAAAKAADELYAQSYSRTLGLPCVGLRYFNVFGPRQDPNGPYAAVIPKFVERALKGQPLLVFGDGDQGRDFVHVSDVARANVRAATCACTGGKVYNIGAGSMTTVNQLVRYVQSTVAEVPVEFRAERAGDVRFSVADISEAGADLDWTPQADFDAGMAETIDWYRRALS